MTFGSSLGYTPYGYRFTTLARPTIAYTGEWFEQSMDGYLLGNGYRPYSASLGRFLSSDSFSPFGTGTLNSYCYCNGDPINNSDPTGHMFKRTSLPAPPQRGLLPGTFTIAGSSSPNINAHQKSITTTRTSLTSTTPNTPAQDSRPAPAPGPISLPRFTKKRELYKAAVANLKSALPHAKDAGNPKIVELLTEVLGTATEQLAAHDKLLDTGIVFTHVNRKPRNINRTPQSAPATHMSEVRNF
ncbi:hypothetical protein D3C76_655110 [compost metagenome]